MTDAKLNALMASLAVAQKETVRQFKGYKLYGVLAAVKSNKHVDDLTVRRGICLARMHGDIFRVQVPPHFQPTDFSR